MSGVFAIIQIPICETGQSTLLFFKQKHQFARLGLEFPSPQLSLPLPPDPTVMRLGQSAKQHGQAI